MRGKLIVIDGADSSGKKTQAELLVAKLKKQLYPVKTLDFPQYSSFFGELVGDYLNGKFGQLNEINPKLASLLYALDRFGQSEKIKEWLDNGYIVVLDRYIESNMAYQSAKIKDKDQQNKFLEWLSELEYTQLGLAKSDIVIYLYVPVEISVELIKARPKKEYLNGKKADIHENDLAYQKVVAENYLLLSKKFNWKIIDCIEGKKLLEKEKIADMVWKAVNSLL